MFDLYMYAVILIAILVAYVVYALLRSIFVSGVSFVDVLTGDYMYLVVALLTGIFVLLVFKYWNTIVPRVFRGHRKVSISSSKSSSKRSVVSVKATPKKSAKTSKAKRQ